MTDVFDVASQRLPGLDVYRELMKVQGDLGHGRLRASTENLLFQHLLIHKREMVKLAGMNFSDVEARALKVLTRKEIFETEPYVSYILAYAAFVQVTMGDKDLLRELRDTLK
jgi:hypothetical protein